MTLKLIDRDKGLKALERKISASRRTLTVGIHEGAERLEIASYHEFGTSTIPARPFLTSWFDARKGEFADEMQTVALRVVRQGGTVDDALGQLGSLYVGQIQAGIRAGIDPPLAEVTIARKGSSKPLIDTGQLVSDITFKVDG
jgi:hypothetical protein